MTKQKKKKKTYDSASSSVVRYPEPEWKKRSLEDYAGRDFKQVRQKDFYSTSENEKKIKKQKKNSRNPSAGNGKKKNAKSKTGVPFKGKIAVKKRFYVFLAFLIAVILIAAFCSVKSLSGSDKKDGQSQDKTSAGGITSGSGITSGGGITSPGAVGIGDGGISGAAVNSGAAISGSAISGGAIGPASVDYENRVYNAIMSSYYISPIGQTKAAVVQTFGPIVRFEDWKGGIYFHRQFPENMYVIYSGGMGEDGLPADTNMCTAVEVSLEKIVAEPEAFTPISWGTVISDESGTGWTDYCYQIALGAGYMITIYCDENGVIQPDTHVLVKTR